MKLSFFTPPQGMAFVDPANCNVADAGQLKPGVIYDVFAVVKNEESVEFPNLQISVTHSAFGIGLPGGTSFIVQPDPINVPPALSPAQPGLASFQFQFMAPPAGHGCLTATIVLNNAKLHQNLTVLTAQQGVTSTISFLVFGDPNNDETMVLTLQQKLENGTLVTPANHWPHQFVVPSMPFTKLTWTPIGTEQIRLQLPRGNAYYSIGINVTIPPTAADSHIFFVRGTVNGVDKGSVSLLVKPDPTFVKPAPGIVGGIESTDVVLIDANGNEVPVFGNPANDTVLVADRNYTLKAIVHNDSRTPAINTVVRFWQSEGGISADGHFIDVQTVTVPGYGHREVTARLPFHSGDLNRGACAIVTVYNAQSDTCKNDYPTFADAHDTLSLAAQNTNQHSPVAWRNTSSRIVFIGERFHIELAAAYPRIPLPSPLPPVELNVESILIPHDWQTLPEAAEAIQMLQASGAQARFPVFLLPKLQDKFRKVDLDIEVKAEDVRVEALELVAAAAGRTGGIATVVPPTPIKRFNLHHTTGDKPIPLTVTGNLPRDAQDGDTILVRCSAIYPKTDGTPGARVAFTDALYVMRH